MAIDFPTATTVGQVYTDPGSGSTFVVTVVGPPAQWVGSGSSTSLDNTYLRKDASNDPVTGTLTVTPSTNVEALVVTQGATQTAAAMRITNEGSGNSLVIEDSASTDSTPIVADSTGRLLIGSSTTTSAALLQVAGDAQVQSLNSGPLAGFRNRIINGDFDIWQRSTSQTIGNTAGVQYFTADRWFNFFDGTGATRTVSRQSFTIGQTDVPDNPKYFYRLDQTVAGTGATYNLLVQRIESVFTFAGQQVTASFWAKAASALTMTVNFSQGFGTGGTPSADVGAFTSSNLSVTTTWQKFSVTTTLPSISGKTLGTNNNDHLTFQFLLPFNTTFTVDIAHVQVEEGPVATDFERRPIGTELALCQRYYCKTYAQAADPATVTSVGNASGVTTAGGFANINFIHPVEMRAAPTYGLYNATTGALGTWRDGAAVDRAVTAVWISTRQGSITCSTASASVGLQGHVVASTEL